LVGGVTVGAVIVTSLLLDIVIAREIAAAWDELISRGSAPLPLPPLRHALLLHLATAESNISTRTIPMGVKS